jgi:hypothetical protein
MIAHNSESKYLNDQRRSHYLNFVITKDLRLQVSYRELQAKLQVYKVQASIPPRNRRRFSRNLAPVPPQEGVHSAAKGDNPAARPVEESARVPRGQHRRKGGQFRRGCVGYDGVDSVAGGQFRRGPACAQPRKPGGESIPPQPASATRGEARGIAWAPGARR